MGGSDAVNQRTLDRFAQFVGLKKKHPDPLRPRRPLVMRRGNARSSLTKNGLPEDVVTWLAGLEDSKGWEQVFELLEVRAGGGGVLGCVVAVARAGRR